ncbi:MAG: DUF6691 family protein [Pseudomonadota bacterium]
MRALVLALIGALFGFGIMLSGMGNPAKVQNFFDIAGLWDPSLAFVMGGALLVSAPGYALLRARPRAWFQWPTRRDIDAPLVWGSATFGLGWGIAGFCPGASLPALGTGRWDVALFVASLSVGLLAARWVSRTRLREERTP